MRTHYAPEVASALFTGKEITLGTLTGKSDTLYALTLVRDARYFREGELTLKLTDTTDTAFLATLSFSFAKHEGETTLWIGGLQGTLPQWGKERIVRATRDLHGLRPKHAVLEAARGVASTFNLPITITAQRAHPVEHVRTMKGTPSPYDEFFIEQGAHYTSKDSLALPLQAEVRSIDDVPSKKKKDWLKRHEFLQQIFTLSSQSLSALQLIGSHRLTTPHVKPPSPQAPSRPF